MSFLDAEIVNLGVEPISASAPAGESVRFDPQFEQLSAEIAKTEALSPVPVDWGAVTQLSSSLLKSKSKDLRVASYLTLGLCHAKGFEGLLNGLALYRNLLKNFWETAFPEKSRMRGRVGAVQWAEERLPVALARKPAAASDELALEVEQGLLDFVAAVEECLANEAPGFVELRQLVQAQADAVRSRRAAAAAEEAAKQQQAEQAKAAPLPEAAGPGEVDAVLAECRTRLFQAAAMLLAADPADPLPYRITRGITWGWQVALPTQEGGITYIPAPDAGVAQRLQQLLSGRDWLAVLREAEAGFLEQVFAFDIQRQCAQALSELGEQYSAARKAILAELQSLLLRLPDLAGLKFVDGTPLFSLATAEWVRSEVVSSQPGAGGNTGAGREGAGDDQELAKTAAEAHRLFSNGELNKGLALFTNGIARESRQRRQFLWKLEMARLCVDAGKPQLALPLLTLLDEQIRRFSLEEWEPELSLAVVQQLFKCRQKLAAAMSERPPDVERQLGELYQRICRIDVNAALTVDF